jgi:hypothetical protein
MTLNKHLAAAAMGAAALGTGSVASAATMIYDISGSEPNSSTYTAQVTLDVVGGQAISGTGYINSSDVAGPLALTLITASTPGVEINPFPGVPIGYRSNDGTDDGGDTVVPIDGLGWLFSVGPNAPSPGGAATFNPWSNGDGTYTAAFFGKLTPKSVDNWGWGAASLTAVAGVPEPATWAMMLVGFGGLGVAMRLRRRPNLAMA